MTNRFKSLILFSFISLVFSTLCRADSFNDCKRAKAAIDKINLCSAAIPELRQKERLERALLRRGNAFMETRQFEAAANDFTSIIKLNPKVAGYYDNRLTALRELGRYKEALADANQSIRLASNSSFAYRSRGLVYDAMGKPREAIDDFSTAISINPADVNLLVDRGKLFAKAGSDKQAIEDFTAALNFDQSSYAALRERGLANKRLGNTNEAAKDLLLYSRIDPSDAEVRQALVDLGRGGQAVSIPEPATPKGSDQGSNHDEKWSGSGFFVSADGHLVTNAHVVEGCKSLNVIHGLNPPVSARVLAKDTTNDLALVLIPTKPEKFAIIRVGAKVGEEIAAFGYPLLGLLATSGNFTRGNISSVAGLGDDTRYLQITAPIQKGNSGGPVVDQSGNLVGVVVSKLNVLAVATETDDIAQNVNFAIKSSVLVNFLDSSGISYSSSGPQAPLSPVDLAEKVKTFTVLVKCSG